MLLNVPGVAAVCDDCRTAASNDHGEVCLFTDAAHALRRVIETGPDKQGPWSLEFPADLVCAVCLARRRTAELDGGRR